MTWLDGLPTIICEDCGHILPPELAAWYQGEVAICKDRERCEHRKEGLSQVKADVEKLKQERGERSMVNVETPMNVAPFPVINVVDKNPNRYQDRARQLVLEYYNLNHLEIGEEIHISEVYIVSFAKTLQNWKALVATGVPNDGLYFEVTYNGDKKETYLDVYTKLSNDVIADQGYVDADYKGEYGA